jgi:protein-disulfide isomerase
MRQRFPLILLSVLTLGVPASPAPANTAAKASHRTDWAHVVAATPAGGFVLGNPKAKVKLVEYGSLTCPHCRAFDEEGVPTLLGKYVKSGQVSWEFRNYIRDAADATAALIARCNGAKSFFPLVRALYHDQPVWFGKAVAAPKEELQKLPDLPPQQQFVAMAKLTGLDSWAAAHGLPAAKSGQCLANLASVDKLVGMTKDANDQHPDFKGTPTFLINGAMVQNAFSWDALEPKLKAALGG